MQVDAPNNSGPPIDRNKSDNSSKKSTGPQQASKQRAAQAAPSPRRANFKTKHYPTTSFGPNHKLVSFAATKEDVVDIPSRASRSESEDNEDPENES